MRNAIIVARPKIECTDTVARLMADVKLNQETYTIYLETILEYGQYFVTEVSDTYLICLLLYAMEHNYDLVFEGDISEDLYIQVSEYLMPAIVKNIKNYHFINIKCHNLVSIEFSPYLTATGVSCGVDSFYTILKNLKHSQKSGLNINALTFFNAGSSGSYGGDMARELFIKRSLLAATVAKELNCKFIAVDSNMNEFLKQDHEQTHVFRTLAIPLALQKLFKTYYFSSGVQYKDFKFTFFDPAFYDILTMPLLSTKNTKFVLVGGESSRLEKVNFIANNQIVQKHLNVCVKEVYNCGKCNKCKRTMLNLYIIDKAEDFHGVFDMNYFYANKKRLIRWALIHKKEVDMIEIVETLKNRKEVKLGDCVYAFWGRVYYGIRTILSKIKKRFRDKK